MFAIIPANEVHLLTGCEVRMNCVFYRKKKRLCIQSLSKQNSPPRTLFAVIMDPAHDLTGIIE